MYSRRHFLKTSATAAAVSLLPHATLRASIATLAGAPSDSPTPGHARRLSAGWEFLQGSLGGPWEAWHSEEVATWQPVAIPHCFNAYDACDPEVPYYRGNGWYRTHVPIANPYAGGERSCTLKAQDSRPLSMWERSWQENIRAAMTNLSSHHGPPPDADNHRGYTCQRQAEEDRWRSDCSALRQLARPRPQPSDLSDFSLYGGMYRHVNLVYVPTVSLATVHVQTKLPSPRGPAEIAVVGTIRTSLPPVSAG
jgi:beta-galactosidase